MKKFFLILIGIFLVVEGNASMRQTLDLQTGIVVEGTLDSSPVKSVQTVSDGMIVTYTFQRVNISSDPLYPNAKMIHIDGFEANPFSGKPAVPFHWDSFAIPSNCVAETSVVDSAYIEREMEISPARPILFNSSNNIYTTENVVTISPYTGDYPQNILSASKLVNYRGVSTQDFCIVPVKYNYANKKTRFYTRIQYKVRYVSKGQQTMAVENDVLDGEIRSDKYLSASTLNYDLQKPLFTTTYTDDDLSNWKWKRSYLIITTPLFESVANRLAEWKRILGMNVEIEVDENWTSGKVLQTVQSKSPMPNYLLIIGDHNQVPAKYSTVGGAHDAPHYTDFYYGLPSDGEVGNMPQIAVGRLPVSTLNEAKIVADKIISYERNPIIDETFYKNAIHCSYFEYTPQERSTQYVETCEKIRNHIQANGINVERAYEAYVDSNYYGTLYRPTQWYSGDTIPDDLLNSYGWNGNATQIRNAINKGVLYVIHRDHGRVDHWKNPEFTLNDIESLSNGRKLPVVFSINCSTGSFYNENCFAKKMLVKENGGCVGIVAAVEESKALPNNYLIQAIIKSAWPNGSNFLYPGFSNPFFYEMGDALRYGAKEMVRVCLPKLNEPVFVGDYYSREHILVNQELYHYFGDPSMQLYTKQPTPFDSIQIERTLNSLTVRIVDRDIEFNTTEDYIPSVPIISVYTPSTQTVSAMEFDEWTYQGDCSNIIVCIRMHNKVPYVVEYGDTIYIQNEEVSGRREYNSNMIKVGENVTSTKPTGSVLFDGGEVVLKANEVVLDKGTTIELGTSFKIETTN